MKSLFWLVVLAVLVLLVIAVAAQQGPKDACNMCQNINTGEGKAKYVCPSKVVKNCNINLNGWCCKVQREHPSCKACFTNDIEEEDGEAEDEE